MAKGTKKPKGAKRERRERRFLPRATTNPMIVYAIGGVGGLVTGAGVWAQWGRVAVLNVPIGIASALLAPRCVPESRSTAEGGGFDLGGALFSTAGLGLLIYAIVACVIPPLAFFESPGAIRVCAFLFGIGLGGDYMIIPLVAVELFDIRVMGRLLGLVLTTDSIAEAVVPLGVAMLRDRTGSYAPGFAVIVALAGAGAVAVALLPTEPRQGEEDSPVAQAFRPAKTAARQP